MSTAGSAYDLVVLVAGANRDWAIERIGREIARHASGRAAVVYEGDAAPLPEARHVLYTHFALLKSVPPPTGVPYSVLFFHPWAFERDLDPAKYRASEVHYRKELAGAHRVIAFASIFLPYLESLGIPRERLARVTAGADAERFRPHARRGDGTVGFVSAFYPRKNPELVRELVRALPHRRFLLLGRGWQRYERFAELCARPNFTYREAAYEDYPAAYAEMDVFCSPSLLEGACLPILEAMMTNVVPVASDTGHARDVIEPGRNGFLFEPGAEVLEVAEKIEHAFALDADVRASVAHLTWERLAREVEELLG